MGGQWILRSDEAHLFPQRPWLLLRSDVHDWISIRISLRIDCKLYVTEYPHARCGCEQDTDKGASLFLFDGVKLVWQCTHVKCPDEKWLECFRYLVLASMSSIHISSGVLLEL